MKSGVCVAFVAMVTVGGCDLLQTREPETPGSSGSTFVPATTPDLVIVNLQNAIREKNKENYVQCFVDTIFTGPQKAYRFEPTVEALATFGAVFSDWSAVSEEQYFRNLAVSKPDGVSLLSLSEQQNVGQTADSVLMRFKYHLVFQHNRANIAQEARGTMELMLLLDRQRIWSISRWSDFRDTSATTWSDFKGAFL